MKRLSLLATISLLFVVSACQVTQDGKIMPNSSEMTMLESQNALSPVKIDGDPVPKALWSNLVSNPLNGYVTTNVSSAIFNGVTPYVAYADGNSTNFTLTVKACIGGATCTAWTTIGSNISADEAYDISMCVYNNGGTANPYVAYREMISWNPLTFKPVVKMYNGSTWSNVGNITTLLGANVSFDWYPQIAANGINDVFVFAKGKVMHYDGTSWSFLGSPVPGATDGYAKIAIYDDGVNIVPYVIYRDSATSERLTLAYYDYNTSSWAFVGARGFGSTTGTVGSFSFYFTATGTPYAFFVDNGNNQAKVMTFNGTSWVSYAAVVTSSVMYYPAIAVDEVNNDVYVAYRDVNNSDRLVVQRSTGTTWTSLGAVSTGWVNYTNIGVDSTNHVPIVSYEDHTLSGIYVKKYQ